MALVAACGGTSLDVGSTGAGAGVGGVAGVAGVGGMPTTRFCARDLPTEAEVGCNYRAALGAPGQTGYCFKGGCHNAATQAGRLDLTPDTFLISRLLEVRAHHEKVCPGNVPCDWRAPACEICSECPSPVFLIDTFDPASSWILRKLDPFIPGTTTSTLSIGCGDAMPTFNTSGTHAYTQEHKDCLIAFFTALAQTPGEWPCAAP